VLMFYRLLTYFHHKIIKISSVGLGIFTNKYLVTLILRDQRPVMLKTLLETFKARPKLYRLRKI
jgi:hypothetical protein